MHCSFINPLLALTSRIDLAIKTHTPLRTGFLYPCEPDTIKLAVGSHLQDIKTHRPLWTGFLYPCELDTIKPAVGSHLQDIKTHRPLRTGFLYPCELHTSILTLEKEILYCAWFEEFMPPASDTKHNGKFLRENEAASPRWKKHKNPSGFHSRLASGREGNFCRVSSRSVLTLPAGNCRSSSPAAAAGFCRQQEVPSETVQSVWSKTPEENCRVEFCRGARQSDLVSVWQHTLVG